MHGGNPRVSIESNRGISPHIRNRLYEQIEDEKITVPKLKTNEGEHIT
jgi:hypothetical protein